MTCPHLSWSRLTGGSHSNLLPSHPLHPVLLSRRVWRGSSLFQLVYLSVFCLSSVSVCLPHRPDVTALVDCKMVCKTPNYLLCLCLCVYLCLSVCLSLSWSLVRLAKHEEVDPLQTPTSQSRPAMWKTRVQLGNGSVFHDPLAPNP